MRNKMIEREKMEKKEGKEIKRIIMSVRNDRLAMAELKRLMKCHL